MMVYTSGSEYETLKKDFHQYFGNRIITHDHKGRRVDKAIVASQKVRNTWIYVGEVMVVALFGFFTLIFGNSTSLSNNTDLVYPLQEVSTLECRTEERSTLSSSCKIDLPIIKGAAYEKYIGEKQYTDIYSVLFGANYKSGRNVDAGAHYAVDIATAKGTPLYAIANAKVYFAGEQAGYGKVVKIQFIYKGEMLFATYAHMESIEVSKGQTLSKGQKIGTVGNSGTTSGGLGGFHVHFEINKGNQGRPIYPFYQCPDSAKGGIAIVNEGLCREEIYTYNYDPIIFLEGANATVPHANTVHASAPEPAESPYLAQMRSELIQLAKYYLGTAYAFGGTGGIPGNPTDCSKLVYDVFAGIGVDLEARSSAEQARAFVSGGFWYDTLAHADIGDLIFFKNTYTTENAESDITHVGIYVGNDLMLHAGLTKVEIVPLDTYWKTHFKGVGSVKQFAKKYNPETTKKTLEQFEKGNKEENGEQHPSAPTTQTPEPSLPSEESTSGLILDFSALSESDQAFFMEWDLVISGNIANRVKRDIPQGLTLTLKNKKDGAPFNGILKQPITLISDTTAVELNPVAITLLSKGTQQITLLPKATGPVYIAINYGMKKIGSLQFSIN